MAYTRLSTKAKQLAAKYYALLAAERGCTKEQCKEVARFVWGLSDSLDSKKLDRKVYMDMLDDRAKARIKTLSTKPPAA